MMTEAIPYDEIDPPVRELVRVLNDFPGIHTYTSCGSHPDHERDPDNLSQNDEGIFYVDFNVDRTDEGWLSLDVLGWVAFTAQLAGPQDVTLEVGAKAPYLNWPGQMLFFRFAGADSGDQPPTADALAYSLETLRDQFYISAEEARDWPTE